MFHQTLLPADAHLDFKPPVRHVLVTTPLRIHAGWHIDCLQSLRSGINSIWTPKLMTTEPWFLKLSQPPPWHHYDFWGRMSCLAGQPHDMNQPSTTEDRLALLLCSTDVAIWGHQEGPPSKENGKERKQKSSARMRRGSNHGRSFLVDNMQHNLVAVI
jgi:hypothetical protein